MKKISSTKTNELKTDNNIVAAKKPFVPSESSIIEKYHLQKIHGVWWPYGEDENDEELKALFNWFNDGEPSEITSDEEFYERQKALWGKVVYF